MNLRIKINFAVIAKLFFVMIMNVSASISYAEPEIHLIHMGGNDCPPCVAWRGIELPKLEKSPVFEKIKFSYITKTIKSSVPSEFFLPDEVKPLKDKLDRASGGVVGSPQEVIIVNGNVYDYWFGAKSAEDLELRISAILNSNKYPAKRCVQRANNWLCEKRY